MCVGLEFRGFDGSVVEKKKAAHEYEEKDQGWDTDWV